MKMKGEVGAKTQIVEKLLRVIRGFPSKTFLGCNPSATEVARCWWTRSFIWACALCIWLPALFSHLARAQVLFGSVVGSVTDTSGAVVPGATVQITDVQTNEHRTAQTDTGGAYTISTVPQGTYRVDVSKQGFQSFQVANVEVVANTVVRVNAQLQIGSVTQTVEISAAAGALLQTDTADVHTEIPAEAMETMPQPTYTYEGLFELSPGVTPPGGQLSGGTNNPSKSMMFSANGTGTLGVCRE